MTSNSIPSLRAVNQPGYALVLGFMLQKDPMSARYICDHLRLSKSTVSNILQTLVSEEIVYPTKSVPEKYGIATANLARVLKLLDPMSDGGYSNKPKQKLTLALSKDVIERAKKNGINISAITEEFLRAVTYENCDRTHDDLVKAYVALFSAIKPVVEAYDLEVEVGKSHRTEYGEVIIEPYWLTYWNELPHIRTILHRTPRIRWTMTTVRTVFRDLYAPRKVLENLIEAVIKTDRKDTLKIQELETSLKLAKAILSPED